MIACLDLEGVLVPEIWINVAERTGIEALRRTTRDEPDYDKLMQYRLRILDERGITLADIQQVIGAMRPLEEAPEFLRWLKSRAQVVILSDTFYQFAAPLMPQLDYPCLFSNRLQVARGGRLARAPRPLPAATERDRRVPSVPGDEELPGTDAGLRGGERGRDRALMQPRRPSHRS